MDAGSAPLAVGANAPNTPTQPNSLTGSNVPQGTPSPGMNVGRMGQSKEQAPPQGQSTPSQSIGDAKATSDPDVFEVKVNGKIVKMSKQEALDRASMSYRANEKFEEASKIQKRIDQITSTAKSNPIQSLIELGLNKEQIRDAMEAWYNKEFIEPEMLSPEQRRLNEQEERLKQYEEQERQRKEQEELEKMRSLTAQEQKYLQTQIIEALEKSKLPKTPSIVGRMAFYMSQNLRNGWEAPMEHIIRQVQNERQEAFGGDMDSMSVDEFMNLYGEAGNKFLMKLRQYDLQKLRESRAQKMPGFSRPNDSPQSTPQNGERKRVYSSDVQKRLNQMRTGKF